MRVWERKSEIRSILGHCQEIIYSFEDDPITKPLRKFKDSGYIIVKIKFNDDSLLNFLEYIRNENVERYSYEFIQSNGFFFCYENDNQQNGIKKPLHHLHVGIMREHADGDLISLLPEELIEHGGPHFKAPQMEFKEFMGIIVANFFNEHGECEEMLVNLGFLTVQP